VAPLDGGPRQGLRYRPRQKSSERTQSGRPCVTRWYLCNKENRGPIFWISAKWHGHFYCYCPEKVGGVRWATNKHPWDAYTPDALKCPRKGFAAGRKSSAETLTEMHPWAHLGPIVGRGPLKCPREGFAAGRKSSAETFTEMHPWAHSGADGGEGLAKGGRNGPPLKF
jgi:hypothetical protein